MWFAALDPAAAQGMLSTRAEYQKYIDPMLAVNDFGVSYTEDGAADATVFFPSDKKPRELVLALVHLGQKSVPLLIDCLTDTRVTAIQFGGNTISKPMKVPLGYVFFGHLNGHNQEHPGSREGLRRRWPRSLRKRELLLPPG